MMTWDETQAALDRRSPTLRSVDKAVEEAMVDLQALAFMRVRPARGKEDRRSLERLTDGTRRAVRRLGDALRLLGDISEKSEGAEVPASHRAEVACLKKQVAGLAADLSAARRRTDGAPGRSVGHRGSPPTEGMTRRCAHCGRKKGRHIGPGGGRRPNLDSLHLRRNFPRCSRVTGNGRR